MVVHGLDRSAHHSLRKVEDIAVPVQDIGAGSNAAEDGPGADTSTRVKPISRPSPGLTSAPSARAQQLGAEADTEHRHLAIGPLCQPLPLRRQPE